MLLFYLPGLSLPGRCLACHLNETYCTAAFEREPLAEKCSDFPTILPEIR